MRVLVIGGTGFIGYHAVNECLQNGHDVTVLALPPLPIESLFPNKVHVMLANFNVLSNEDIKLLLDGQDAFVYAAGVDDRTLPAAPAYPFFYEENVKPCVRLVKLACESGVKRGVLLSSYFAFFDRLWPHKRMFEHHPYIRSRKEQAEQSFRVAKRDFTLMVLELPYIFGAMPGRLPLWAPIIKYIRSPFPLFYTRGGTNMISVKHVAEAIVGAIEKGQHGKQYLVGEKNLTWTDWLQRLCELTGKKKKVRIISMTLFRWVMKGLQFYYTLNGREGGLNPVVFTDIQTSKTFFDPASSREELGYGQGGLDESLRDTVNACIGYRRA